MSLYSIAGIDLELDERGQIYPINFQHKKGCCTKYSTQIEECVCKEHPCPPCGIDSGASNQDIVDALAEATEKLCSLVDIFNAATTTTSAGTFVNELDMQYIPICVDEGDGCKKTKILKIILNPITCEEVDRIIFEADAITPYSGSGVIVDCKDDDIINTQIIELCKNKNDE